MLKRILDLPLGAKIGYVGIIIILCMTVYQKFFYHHPKRGAIIRYEVYKGVKCPIKADGKGGFYRWIGDVPWAKFTIEEKVMMALRGGGWLSDKDIQEIKTKYGVK